MSTSVPEPELAGLELVRPMEAEVPRTCGVYSWWLDASEFPTPETAGLRLPSEVPRLLHSSGNAELLYVGRARRNLRQRITGQHLRRTRSSALRRTLLAILLSSGPSWRDSTALDGRGRVVLESRAEKDLTDWMQERLFIGWVTCANKGEVDDLEKRWICEHQPALNTDGTRHGPELTDLKRTLITGITSNVS